MRTGSRAPAGVRPMHAGDAEACGRAAFEAHRCVAEMNNFPPEHPSVDFSIAMITAKLVDPHAHGWVAERDGEVAGSVFATDFGCVAAIGPLTVHPRHEGQTGRALMDAALGHARERGFESVRLVQSPSHLRSLALYAKLGFEAREPLVLMHGTPRSGQSDTVRPAELRDEAACIALCERVHGFSRSREIHEAFARQTGVLVERDGEIRAYASAIGFRGHAVGETAADIAALVCATASSAQPGFFLPVRDAALFSWALESGLKALWPAMLMSRGRYREPQGAFLPSIAF